VVFLRRPVRPAPISPFNCEGLVCHQQKGAAERVTSPEWAPGKLALSSGNDLTHYPGFIAALAKLKGSR
jgi:hypothetical protein